MRFVRLGWLRSSVGVAVLAAGLLASAGPVAAATSDVVDGTGGGGGRIQARVSGDTASIVSGGVPWVFYGANPEYGYRLRMATLGSTPAFTTLDGAGGGSGRTTDSVGTDVSAVPFGGNTHVFYLDDTAHTLRHATLHGSTGTFETLDGNTTTGGRTTNHVGAQSFALIFQNKVNVFYADTSAGDLRRAVLNGSTWSFSVVDGNSNAGGRTTAAVGAAVKAGIWGGRLHVLYSEPGGGLREASSANGSTWTYATLTTHANHFVTLLRVSDSEVHVAYDEVQQGSGVDRIFSGLWNGASWALDAEVSHVEKVSGMTAFMDGSSPVLAAGIVQCEGSGGCDEVVGVGRANGDSFDDPYLSASFTVFGIPQGNPSSAVTIGGVGRLFVGGFGSETEPDIFDQVLLSMKGPF